jgi:hypothetical protein
VSSRDRRGRGPRFPEFARARLDADLCVGVSVHARARLRAGACVGRAFPGTLTGRGQAALAGRSRGQRRPRLLAAPSRVKLAGSRCAHTPPPDLSLNAERPRHATTRTSQLRSRTRNAPRPVLKPRWEALACARAAGRAGGRHRLPGRRRRVEGAVEGDERPAPRTYRGPLTLRTSCTRHGSSRRRRGLGEPEARTV